MTRTRFHQGLDELREKLLTMGGMAEQAVELATQAYRNRDLKTCKAVLTGEHAINAAVMKINADLERVGDQAVNVVERVMNLVKAPQVDLPVDIPRIASTAAGMVRRALESFIEGKAELA